MRFIILLALLFLFDWYAYQAFQLWSADWSSSARLLMQFIYWSIPLASAVLLVVATNSNISQRRPEWFTILQAVLTAAYFAKFFIVIILLVDDFRRFAVTLYQAIGGEVGFDNSRSMFMAQFAILTGSIPFILLTYGVLRNRYRYKIFRQKVQIDGLHPALEGLKIVQISDVHSGSFTEKNGIKRGIDMINEQTADFVFFTGDLVNNAASEMRPFKNIFNQIRAKYGVYSVTGNHDYGDYVRWENMENKRANFNNLLETHREMGWDILMNEHRIIDIQGANVAVIGVENYSGNPRFPKYGDLSKAYQGMEGADLKLLLSHDPSHWKYEVTKQFTDIDITFSGHTHGMQFGIEIPGWFKWSPIKYVYKEWAGLYQVGQQYLYVNRGFGFLGYPGRVGILPEITLMELSAKK
jgi:predicted MPP superfamily phosphohydrolase